MVSLLLLREIISHFKVNGFDLLPKIIVQIMFGQLDEFQTTSKNLKIFIFIFFESFMVNSFNVKG